MNSPSIITGLDIGSSKVSGVVADANQAAGCSILAHATYPSEGISKGEIVDLNEAVDSVSRVLAKLADKIGKRPRDIYVSVSGQGIRGERARGMVPLSMRGREVTKADMARCVNAASTLRLPFDREIIHEVVHSFSIDDQPWIKSPVGLYASRLACEIYVITANTNHIQNINKCVTNAGYDVRGVVFAGMADGAAFLDEAEKEEGTVLLNTGALLTELSVFYGGALREMEVVAAGLDNIKGDFRESAELNTILDKVRSKTDEFLKKGGRITSIKLAGGIIFNDSIVDLLSEKIAYPIKIGSPKDVRGDMSSLDSMKAATAIGVTKYVSGQAEKRPAGNMNIIHRLSEKVVEIFNNYF